MVRFEGVALAPIGEFGNGTVRQGAGRVVGVYQAHGEAEACDSAEQDDADGN